MAMVPKVPTTLEHTKILPTTFDKNPIINAAPPHRLAVSTNAVAMEGGNDPDFNNTHGEELSDPSAARADPDRRRSCDAGRHTKGAGTTDAHGGAGARENEARWGSRHVRQEAYRRRLRHGTRAGRAGRRRRRRGPGGRRDAKRGCKTPNGAGAGAGVSKCTPSGG